MRSSKRPVRDTEVERLAREALTLHWQMPGPFTEDAVNTAMALYTRAYGYGASLVFVNTVDRELREAAWKSVQAVS